MFIKRNRRHTGDAECTSVLLVQGERVADKRPPGRPKLDAKPPASRVVHRTLANLSKLPESLIKLIEAYARGEKVGVIDHETVVGPGYGPLAATYAIASSLGIVDLLGDSRMGRLGLFLVLARVCHQGSRLSAVKWAESHAVTEILGLDGFDEDALYDALDWLAAEQDRIEIGLAKRLAPSTLYLYDVTSSYLEGQQNELAASGYNRDGKRFKKQIVVGLLTDEAGEPISVRVYSGNTSDPTTVGDQVRFVADKLGAKSVIFVGDRGMLKTKPREEIAAAGFQFLTALTDAQVRPLVKKGAIQLELFDEKPAEVDVDGRRMILRLNPDVRARHRQRRRDQLAKIAAKLETRNAHVEQKPRAKPEASLRLANALLATYHLDRFVSARLEGRRVVLSVDETKKSDTELLDGCYVLETDVARETMPTDVALSRYMDLQKVERDFRTMKTGLLEIRPVFVRKATRTRGHALVTMLALKIVRDLERRMKPLGLDAKATVERLQAIRLVTFADPSLGLWHLPATYPIAQREVLALLPPLPAPKLSRGPTPATPTQ